jgi:dynein heavy chain
VTEFRKNFELHGPAIPGIAPREALNRLREFSDEYSIRKRRFDSYHSGENLFGLPNKDYPELDNTEKQLKLLEQLYSLYQKVNDTIARWKEFSWSTIEEEIQRMDEAIEGFAKDCQRLPGVLKQWEAYKDLKTEIENMTTIIPIVDSMAKPVIRDRHWEEVMEMTKTTIPYQSETFSLQQLLDAPILDFIEEIEEIADSAVKQAKLEK